MLSLGSSVVSTASSAHGASFTKIGAGACGTIFAQDGRSRVYKLCKTDQHEFLWNDYTAHNNIANCFKEYRVEKISIPSCYYFSPHHDARFFNEHPGLIEAAKEKCNLPTSVLVTERIPALPEPTRHLLIDTYCATINREKAKADVANKDCLVRVYLGSTQGRSSMKFFSLRNFKLHLNQVLELGLDAKTLAQRMGIAMAVIHWAAKKDARDVEFVLGSSSETTPPALGSAEVENMKPMTYTGPSSRKNEDFFRQITKLWVLDFNQVRPITMDKVGVAEAVQAAKVNDPYIPKPLQKSAKEKELWNAFALKYLEMAHTILKGQEPEVMKLPVLFLRGLVDVEREKRGLAEEAGSA
ncbi:zinc finger protein-domain-containing protein [Chaetomidium leptoderma]|uniref:Zinc finger protein-domain-containing protein n=1 Tax=Chaetomidium leptoderma TaxID=669021 RepID=A0AAN6VD82_9PEZI|nr:zinc finger protein-domain-containing protein [Chaetomidium leptoderma]